MSLFSRKVKKPDPSIKLGEYNPGDIDPTTGREMIYICYQTPDFLVSIDRDYNLNWFGSEKLKYAPDFGEVSSQVNLLDALVNRIFGDKKNRLAYKKILGDVLSTLLDDEESTTAKQILEETKNRILLHSKERIRMAYINTSILTVIFIGLLTILTVKFRADILEQVGDLAIFRILACALLGGVGAFVTTFARFKDYQGSIISGLPIHRLDGFLRVFYGMVAGIIISLAIKSKMLAGFADDNEQPWLLYFFAMIAGASEVLIPNLVKQAENQTTKSPAAEGSKGEQPAVPLNTLTAAANGQNAQAKTPSAPLPAVTASNTPTAASAGQNATPRTPSAPSAGEAKQEAAATEHSGAGRGIEIAATEAAKADGKPPTPASAASEPDTRPANN